jgi:hypothetical protein
MKKIKIDKELSRPIMDWINNNSDNLETLLPERPPHDGYIIGAQHLNIKDDALIDSGFPYYTLEELNKHILKEYGLSTKTPHDPANGIFLSYSTKGHSVYIHKDKNPDKKHTHVRFNYMLNKSVGGDPVISDVETKIKEGEVWVCVAGKYFHGTTEVTGKKPRVMISFGHKIENKVLEKLESE